MTDHNKGNNPTGLSNPNRTLKPEMSTDPYNQEQSLDSYFKSVLDSLPDWVWEVDQNGYITYSNSAIESILGYVPRQITGKSILTLVPQSDADKALQLLDKQWGLQNNSEYIKHGFYSNEGKEVYLQTTGNPFYDHSTKSKGFRFVSRTVESSKTAEMASFSVDNINEAIALMDKNREVLYVNQAFTSIFGYTNDEIVGQSITILGSEKSLISSAQTEDVTDALMQAKSVWQGEVLRKCKSGQYIPCLLSAAGIRNEKNEVEFFIGTYLDLRSMKHTDQMQKNALKATINAVCNAIDERNVLKGHHQEQVTDLAVAIAFEMGKDLNFIEGLTLASHLHDLGEMYIPPEISAKEGALSQADYELVKIHPIKAYEILKDIKFPWPVANIVLQHHERMNGSGYPKGLKGDEIMLEARILAVADVVCTMLTDRPYRSACSIESCIDELEINKGTLYDPRVVDICLRLVREKSYQLKSPRFTVSV